MKVVVHYTKLPDGQFEVGLIVKDPGDYPISGVFSKGSYPSQPDFQLGGGSSYCGETFQSIREAQEWVREQMEALRLHLQEWRATQVPDDEIYEI